MAVHSEIAGSQIDGARDYQEDAFLITHLTDANGAPSALVIVADGMGGHAAGNVASNMAVQAFSKSISLGYPKEEVPEILNQSVLKANSTIAETIRETPALNGMGCTVVGAIIEGKKFWWVSVGDSHLYLLRGRKLTKLNDDHSYGGFLDRMEAAGTPIESEPGLSRNMLMSAVTGEDIAEIDCPLSPFTLEHNDKLIICSDGLDTLSSGKIIQYTDWSDMPKECAEALLNAIEDMATPRQDNATVVIVKIIDETVVAKAEAEAGAGAGARAENDEDITAPNTEDEEMEKTEVPVNTESELEGDIVDEIVLAPIGGYANSQEGEFAQEKKSVKAVPSIPAETINKIVDNRILEKNKVGLMIGVGVVILIGVAIGANFMFGTSKSEKIDKEEPMFEEALVLEEEPVLEEKPVSEEKPVLKKNIAEKEIVSEVIDKFNDDASNEKIQKQETVADKKIIIKTKIDPVEEIKSEPDPKSINKKEFQDTLKNGGKAPLMVVVPAGSFSMGGFADFNERPRHDVSIKSFAVSKNEVTINDYKAFINATNRKLRSGNKINASLQVRPVVYVTWDDAYYYTKWLSEQTGNKYRLLSESEWEYAASAGNNSPFWWGYEEEPNRAHCFNCETGLDPRSPAKTGMFEANQFGLYDTAGNASEWVEDCWHENYIGAPSDNEIWEGGDCTYRVVRGGSYSSPQQSIRSAKRDKLKSNRSYDHVGIRIARDLD